MAHLLMLHGHPVGYLPPTYSSEIMYDSNTTEKEKIDALVVRKLSFNVDVTANSGVSTVVDWTGVDKSKILYSWVWWSNASSDQPTYATLYYDNTYTGALNTIIHKWSVTQRVNFYVGYIYKG